MNFFRNTPIYALMSGDIKGFFLYILYLLPALVIAISFHEFAHAWMANKMGDPTAKNMGRMTLDPVKHFDLWGFLMLILVGFGWGRPVPVNSRNFHNYKKGNILVSLAGVTTNLILSFVFFGIYVLLAVLGVNSEIISIIILNVVYLNLILCFFNLIPIPPLDGHHLIDGWIARRSGAFYAFYHRYGFFVLIAVMMFTDWLQVALTFLVSNVISLYYLFFGLFV